MGGGGTTVNPELNLLMWKLRGLNTRPKDAPGVEMAWPEAASRGRARAFYMGGGDQDSQMTTAEWKVIANERIKNR